MIQKLESMLFRKQYELIQSQIANLNMQTLRPQQKIIYEMTIKRLQMWRVTAVKKQLVDFSEYQDKISKICKQYTNVLPQIVITIHYYAMKAFLFEVETNEDPNQKQQLQRRFLKQLTKLPALLQIFKDQRVVSLFNNSLYFKISLLELYVKKNTRIKRKQQRAQLTTLCQILQKQAANNKQVSVLCKRLYMILIHLKIHNLNTFSNELTDQTLENLDLCIKTIQGKEQTLINFDTVVVLLYNCLKTLLGFNQLNAHVVQRLQRLYQLFDMKSFKKSYPWHIFQMFFIIKIMIFKKKQQVEEKDKIEQKLSQFAQKFSVFLNLNMDEIIVSLNEITRNIVRHKVASLSTIIGIKLGIIRFSKDFLQIMHDSPFNNDVQTIKLCLELFQFRQYQKIQNLLQTVLSVPASKKLRMREVLISMCSILIGLFLQHRQQGLLYNKLNHQNFLALKTSQQFFYKAQILKQQTFLQHVGFGYYNIACHEVYLENREIYLTKALENFIRSYQLNSDNYLLSYCMSKIYLQMYDYQNAYKHAMQACKSHRGSWAPFCLLACVYMCDRKFQKSFLTIQQLLKKYPEVPILHYIRAYLQANKILLEVEHDQQIEAAKMLGEQYYINHFERLLKHKSISFLTQYAQNYYQLSIGLELIDPDENFFSPQNISANINQGFKYLLNIIVLFEQVGQYGIVENLLKIFPQMNVQTLYHKAILLQKRKQYKQARQEYLKILKLNHTHSPTLVKLAQLPKSDDIQSYKQCYYHLEQASKFVNDGQFMLAKGILLSKLQRLQEANKVLLTNRELAWCSFLPDLLYYY